MLMVVSVQHQKISTELTLKISVSVDRADFIRKSSETGIIKRQNSALVNLQ